MRYTPMLSIMYVYESSRYESAAGPHLSPSETSLLCNTLGHDFTVGNIPSPWECATSFGMLTLSMISVHGHRGLIGIGIGIRSIGIDPIHWDWGIEQGTTYTRHGTLYPIHSLILYQDGTYPRQDPSSLYTTLYTTLVYMVYILLKVVYKWCTKMAPIHDKPHLVCTPLCTPLLVYMVYILLKVVYKWCTCCTTA